MGMCCPACQAELAPYRCELSSLEIDCCFHCRGLWFDRNELRRFFSSPKLYKLFRLPEEAYGRIKTKDTGGRACPRCVEATMGQVALDKVVVDECGQCQGVWLDSGEICRLIDMYEEKKLKGKSETAKQIRKGSWDRTPLGQASRLVTLSFKMLF